MADGSIDLYAKLEVRQGSAGLLAQGIIRNIFSRQLLGRFPVKHNGTPVELLGRFEAQAIVELLGKGVTRHDGVPVELLNRSVIRHTGIPREILGRSVIRHTTSRDLNARVEICHWADLGGVFITRHSMSLDLPALFWVRQAYRLWTNRRYVNGVVELNETLIGNAIFEYVIEGVMQDIQSYLINAGLDYSEWTDIILTPKLIRRATNNLRHRCCPLRAELQDLYHSRDPHHGPRNYYRNRRRGESYESLA